MPYGWTFWMGTKPVEECDNVRLYFRDGMWCVCPAGVEPGDSDSYVRGTEKLARQVYRELLWGV